MMGAGAERRAPVASRAPPRTRGPPAGAVSGKPRSPRRALARLGWTPHARIELIPKRSPSRGSCALATGAAGIDRVVFERPAAGFAAGPLKHKYYA